MKTIVLNRIYEYKQHQYQVIDFIRQKTPNAHGEGSWVDAVEYQRIDENGDGVPGAKYSRELNDFAEKFLPISLWKNDEIIAISMGKVVGVFKVENIDEDNNIAFFSNGNAKMSSSRTIAPISGEIKIHGDKGDIDSEHTQFFYLSPRYDRILSLQKNIDRVIVKLNECKECIVKKSSSLTEVQVERIETNIDNIIKITEE